MGVLISVVVFGGGGYVHLRWKKNRLAEIIKNIEQAKTDGKYQECITQAQAASQDLSISEQVQALLNDCQNDFKQQKYNFLENLLKKEKWIEADRQTTDLIDLILKAESGKSKNLFTDESLEQFSCDDFKNIDNLWIDYSGGIFGISVQKTIYLETGNTPERDFDWSTYNKFADRIGWREKEKWLKYNDLKVDANPKKGYLPTITKGQELKTSIIRDTIFSLCF